MAAETYEGWTRKFLSALGAPPTNENLAAIYSIIAQEGSTFTWNPLAISGAGTGANSSGVGNLPDEATGITATVNFLNTAGANDYPGRIVAPLRSGNGRQALSGIDASGAWAGDFPNAYSLYTEYLGALPATGARPLPSQQDIGAAQDATPLIPSPGAVVGAVTNPLDSIASVLGSVGHFFSLLTQGSTWVRIGEILGGIIILYFAYNILSKDISLPDVATIAKVASTA